MNRPLLQTHDPRERLASLFAVRDPLYRSIADFKVDTGHFSSRSVVRQIISAFCRDNSIQGNRESS
jgi:shikimate kinase